MRPVGGARALAALTVARGVRLEPCEAVRPAGSSGTPSTTMLSPSSAQRRAAARSADAHVARVDPAVVAQLDRQRPAGAGPATSATRGAASTGASASAARAGSAQRIPPPAAYASGRSDVDRRDDARVVRQVGALADLQPGQLEPAWRPRPRARRSRPAPARTSRSVAGRAVAFVDHGRRARARSRRRARPPRRRWPGPSSRGRLRTTTVQAFVPSGPPASSSAARTVSSLRSSSAGATRARSTATTSAPGATGADLDRRRVERLERRRQHEAHRRGRRGPRAEVAGAEHQPHQVAGARHARLHGQRVQDRFVPAHAGCGAPLARAAHADRVCKILARRLWPNSRACRRYKVMQCRFVPRSPAPRAGDRASRWRRCSCRRVVAPRPAPGQRPGRPACRIPARTVRPARSRA